MNNRGIRRIRFILFTVLLLAGSYTRAQDIETLRKQMGQAEKEIERLNVLINDNRSQQKNSLDNLKLVDQKITARRKIIQNLDKQIEVVVKQLGQRGSEIASNASMLDSLKEQYRDMVRAAYISYRSNNIAAFIFASENFQDAVRRIYYVRRIGEESAHKVAHIDSLSTVLNGEIQSLKGRQTELSELMGDKSKEIGKLSLEQKQYKTMTANLKGQESKLTQEASNNRAKLDALQRQIEKIIVEETSKGARPADAGASLVLSGRLEQNKGRLPLPVRGGVIVDRFGIHDHPTQKGVKINNKGVNLACKEGSTVSSVFEGEVRRVFLVPGMGSSVIIRHGNYLSVYSNLKQVNIAQGDKVTTGQAIGVASGESSGQTTVHFELWHESDNLNPEEWVAI